MIPASYSPSGADRTRLDVWFHGRGETLSEVNFLDERRRQAGQFTPADTIVLHPYGRYCNAFKFAGEVDVLEAIEAVRRSTGSMTIGSRSAAFRWEARRAGNSPSITPIRWFAANPGAGFAETRRFLEDFQDEEVAADLVRAKLWHLYDCTDSPRT